MREKLLREKNKFIFELFNAKSKENIKTLEAKKEKLKQVIIYLVNNYLKLLKKDLQNLLILSKIDYVKKHGKSFIGLYFIQINKTISFALFDKIYEKVINNIDKNISKIKDFQKFEEILKDILQKKDLDKSIERLYNLPAFYMSKDLDIIYPIEFLIENEEKYKLFLLELEKLKEN